MEAAREAEMTRVVDTAPSDWNVETAEDPNAIAATAAASATVTADASSAFVNSSEVMMPAEDWGQGGVGGGVSYLFSLY